MADTIRVTMPKSLEAFRKIDPASAPVLANAAQAEERISNNLEETSFRSITDTVYKPHFVVGGELAASGTINFAAASDPRSPSIPIDCSTKRLLAIEFICPGDNAAVVTVAPGASNPFPFNGATKSLDIYPGGRELKDFRTNAGANPSLRLPAIGASVKELDVTIGAGDSMKWTAVLGD
jgi:hypothetical protein